MQLQKISLEERLWRLWSGYSASPEYAEKSILNLANMSLSDYLESHPYDQERLSRIFYVTEEPWKTMTYLEMAVLVDEQWEGNIKRLELAEILYALAVPFIFYCRERKGRFDEQR